MRRSAALAATLPALALAGLVAAGAIAQTAQPALPSQPLAAELKRVIAEADSAEAQARRLERQAESARDEADKLRARQAAAAEAIAAAEARISAADVRARMVAARIAERRATLDRERAPAGNLLAGLALMADRPPMLTVLSEGSTEEFVRVRLLLDSTLPAIRRRTAALAEELQRGRRLQAEATAARGDLVGQRRQLAERKAAFARLEARALQLAEERGGAAIGAGDMALARREDAARLGGERRRGMAAADIARLISEAPPAPPRPIAPSGERAEPTIAYRLPAAAPVTEGFGAIDDAGIRSRGLTLATARGSAVSVPAAGTIRFAGPFRRYDGIVIIDHGGGWISLILNVRTDLKPGDRVALGAPLGRALGPIGVELSKSGTRHSPAIIAGSSRMLSNRGKNG